MQFVASKKTKNKQCFVATTTKHQKPSSSFALGWLWVAFGDQDQVHQFSYNDSNVASIRTVPHGSEPLAYGSLPYCSTASTLN